MGIQSGSATFTRFYVPEPVTEEFWTFVREKLSAGRFNEPDDVQEETSGFARWEDFFESSFDDGSYHKGEYIVFHFRTDVRKVPSIVLKKFVHDALRKYRNENEGRWPSRQERREIQEEMRSMLLNRSLPQPSAFEVVWNPSSHQMLLGTTSTRMMEAFLEVFEKNFQIYPIPLYHANWAHHLAGLTVQEKDALSGLVETKSATAMEDGRFLGFEFLTWIWFFVEKGEGRLQLPDGKVGEIHLGERFVLTLPREGREKIVCTTQANSLHEARTALQKGKFVQEMQLLIIVGDNEYLLTLDSGLWAVKSLRTPRQMTDFREDDEDGFFLEKMYFIEEISSALNTLYTGFLKNRLTSSWEREVLPSFKAWMENPKEATLPPGEEFPQDHSETRAP